MLVTGASGLLGSNFITTANKRYENIIAIYNQHPINIPGTISLEADISDEIIVDEIFSSFKPKWVIHCAALTNVDWCEEHPKEAREFNVDVPRNLARNARLIGSKFIYISTDAIFDGSIGNYSETDETNPINKYAESKLAGEKAVIEELNSSLVIRTNIYGWNLQNKLSIAEWILFKLESTEIVPGFYDVIFNPILVNDLGEIILNAIDQEIRGIYNIAGSQACSKYEFAQHIANIFGLNNQLIKPISVNDSKLKAVRPKNTSLQTHKICRSLHISIPNIIQGLQRFKALRDSGYSNKLKSYGGDKNAQN